jgi:dTDP-4-dehydrorhamnose 3,5-epimerase
MPVIRESKLIRGVFIVQLKQFADERGRFIEVFRKEWFRGRTWGSIQNNQSESKAGVLRGLHYHHKQVDYWHVIQGRMRAGLVDLRQSSRSYGQADVIEINHEDHLGLYIPVGVAHGFAALTQVTLFYIVDNYYDGQDEYGIAWNDPDLGLDWGVSSPIVSERDNNNPLLREIPSNQLPR